MKNPIQVVLDAEIEAQLKINNAAQDAQERIQNAQLQAREITKRNELRIEQVAKRYESRCRRDLKVKITAMVSEADKNLDEFIHLSSKDRDQIIETVFLSFSPRSSSQE